MFTYVFPVSSTFLVPMRVHNRPSIFLCALRRIADFNTNCISPKLMHPFFPHQASFSFCDVYLSDDGMTIYPASALYPAFYEACTGKDFSNFAFVEVAGAISPECQISPLISPQERFGAHNCLFEFMCNLSYFYC